MNTPTGHQQLAFEVPTDTSYDTYEPRGEVVEFHEHRYDVFGWIHENPAAWDGKRGCWGWIRLPHSNSSASVFHSNGGEGVETREKAIALAKMDATRQNRVRNLAAAYPPLTGPLPTTLEPVVQELEPGYERVVHFGREFRLIHQGGRGFQITTGAGKLLCGVAALLTRESALSNIESFGFRSLPHEALRFVRWNDETRVHCVMCEAGFAWGREKSRKAVVDVAGAGAVFVCDGAFHLRTLGLEIPCEAIPEAPGEDLQTRSSTKAPKEKGPRGAEQVELHGHTHAVTMLAGSTP